MNDWNFDGCMLQSLLFWYLESVMCSVIIVQSVQLCVVYDCSYHLVM